MAPVCMCVQVLSCLTPIDLYWRVSLLVVVEIIASNAPGKGVLLYGVVYPSHKVGRDEVSKAGKDV